MQAQEIGKDTIATKHLEQVTIVGARPIDGYSITRKVVVDSIWSTITPQLSLADVLSAQSPVFIKSYGVGALATPSIRGSSNSQSTILWNGLNLQSPMNGTADFSLFPMAIADKVSIQYGGESARQGSAVIGGAILLDNIPRFNKGLSVSGRWLAGSFGRLGQQYDVVISKKNFFSSTKFFQQTSQNNFSYVDQTNPSLPTLNQINDKTQQTGLLQQFSFKTKNRQLFNARLWYQENVRQIPPNMGVTYAKAIQTDQTFRYMMDHEKAWGDWKIMSKAAYFNDLLKYVDPTTITNSWNRSQVFIGDIRLERKIKNQIFSIGSQTTINRANTNNYNNVFAKQDRYSMYGNYKIGFLNDRFFAKLNLRDEFVNGRLIPLQFSVGLGGEIWKDLSLLLSASRNYRVPTLNDLYWSPGGNPNLLPEDAFMEDIQLKYNKSLSNWNFGIDLSAYNTVTHQAIVWVPLNSSVYSPVNVYQTWARGTESRLTVGKRFGKLHLNTSIQYHYTLSTILASVNPQEVGKQNIYVPTHTGVASLTATWNGLILQYSQNFVGLRYTVMDDSDWVEGYSIGNLLASYAITYKKYSANIFLQVNNIWNVEYQVLENIPTPGINFQTGLNLTFNQLFTEQTNN